LSKIILLIKSLNFYLLEKFLFFTFDSSDKARNGGDIHIIDETEQTSAAFNASIQPTFQPRNIM
jgi:hypothetical protein